MDIDHVNNLPRIQYTVLFRYVMSCPNGGGKFSGTHQKTVCSTENTSNKNTQLSKRILNKMYKKV